jgi:hypothetical protein
MPLSLSLSLSSSFAMLVALFCFCLLLDTQNKTKQQKQQQPKNQSHCNRSKKQNPLQQILCCSSSPFSFCKKLTPVQPTNPLLCNKQNPPEANKQTYLFTSATTIPFLHILTTTKGKMKK